MLRSGVSPNLGTPSSARGSSVMSKNAIRALLCSGLIILATIGFIVFAGFRSGTRTRPLGAHSNLNAAGISVSDQASVAQTQPDQRTFAEVGALLKRIADAPEPSIFSVDKTADEIGKDPAALFAYLHDRVRT